MTIFFLDFQEIKKMRFLCFARRFSHTLRSAAILSSADAVVPLRGTYHADYILKTDTIRGQVAEQTLKHLKNAARNELLTFATIGTAEAGAFPRSEIRYSKEGEKGGQLFFLGGFFFCGI